MQPQSRKSALLVEMLGSLAVCSVVFATDLLLGVRRRRDAIADLPHPLAQPLIQV